MVSVERKAREEHLSFEKRKTLREESAKPVFDELGAWLKSEITEVLTKSSIGKAFTYTYSLSLWERLGRYFEDGRIEIDNNWVENSIRLVAIGRKIYLLAIPVIMMQPSEQPCCIPLWGHAKRTMWSTLHG